ncbi:NAD-dependent epimerase/dehydratase family protein [Methylobacterium mesophilicum]
MSRKIFITGGTGRVGKAVLSLLIERGYNIRATSTQSRPASNNVEWLKLDLRQSMNDLPHHLADCDAVLHLAAEMKQTTDMPFVNGTVTGLLASAAEAAGVKFMAYISSVAVYGSGQHSTCSENDRTVTAHCEIRGEVIANQWMRTYARTKLLGEQAVSAVANAVDYVIFRPTVIVDKDDLYSSVSASKFVTTFRGFRNTHHIYVGDVAEALIWAMERSINSLREPSVSIYNLSDETIQDPSQYGLIAQANRSLGLPAPQRPWHPLFDKTLEYCRYSFGRRPKFMTPYMRFPSTKLQNDGFALVYGMSDVRREIFDVRRSGN